MTYCEAMEVIDWANNQFPNWYKTENKLTWTELETLRNKEIGKG